MLDRRPLFGRIERGCVRLTSLGRQVADVWLALPARNPGLLLDEFVVMPDHFHGLAILTTLDPTLQPPSIVDVVRQFKGITSRLYHHFKSATGRMDLPASLWQRSYYDRILRSERDLEEKRAYIQTNPLRYELKRRGEM